MDSPWYNLFHCDYLNRIRYYMADRNVTPYINYQVFSNMYYWANDGKFICDLTMLPGSSDLKIWDSNNTYFDLYLKLNYFKYKPLVISDQNNLSYSNAGPVNITIIEAPTQLNKISLIEENQNIYTLK